MSERTSVAAPRAGAGDRVDPQRADGVAVHLRALDGWRGVAVAAVVAFHAGLLPGGWLGVDLFFVLSGFLITRLVVVEHHRSGGLSMRGFWSRRARRLLPALVVFLAGVAAYAAWYPDPLAVPARLPSEMVATAAYVANWYQLYATSGYWDAFAVPSPLSHMWSLAIEEQFYLVFPPAIVLLGATLRRSPARVAALLAAGAVASWALGVALLAGGASFERVYLGTDTRLGAILIGGAAGAASVLERLGPRLSAMAGRLAPRLVPVVLAALVLVDGDVEWPAWRWLVMPAFEVAVCVLLLHAAGPRPRPSALDRGVGVAPLVWLGGISYSLYLWHVPTLLVAERGLRDAPRWVVVVAGVAAAVVLAQASTTWLERPLRRARFGARGWVALGVAGLVLVGASVWWARSSSAPSRELEARRGAAGAATWIVEGAGAPLRPPTAELPLPRPAARAPRLLLLGDSLAFDLEPGLAEVAAADGVTLSSSALVGCAAGGMEPVPDAAPGQLGAPEQLRRCEEWTASWPSLAERAAPDVALVVRTAARRPHDATGGGDDQCAPSYLAWYRDVLEREARALAPHVGVVAFTTSVNIRLGRQVDPVQDRETACRNRVVEEVAADLDGVVAVPLGSWVCPGGRCIEELDGVQLRPDGLHFQGPGARVAARWILDQLYGG